MFSEICAGLDTGSTVKMHVHQLLQHVLLFGTRADGELLHDERLLGPRRRNRALPELYVDPGDGLTKDRT